MLKAAMVAIAMLATLTGGAHAESSNMECIRERNFSPYCVIAKEAQREAEAKARYQAQAAQAQSIHPNPNVEGNYTCNFFTSDPYTGRSMPPIQMTVTNTAILFGESTVQIPYTKSFPPGALRFDGGVFFSDPHAKSLALEYQGTTNIYRCDRSH